MGPCVTAQVTHPWSSLTSHQFVMSVLSLIWVCQTSLPHSAVRQLVPESCLVSILTAQCTSFSCGTPTAKTRTQRNAFQTTWVSHMLSYIAYFPIRCIQLTRASSPLPPGLRPGLPCKDWENHQPSRCCLWHPKNLFSRHDIEKHSSLFPSSQKLKG